jgi:hypothetical protein
LDQSDFITHFLDVSYDQLKKPANTLAPAKLQSLLDLILRNPASVTNQDPFKEDVKVTIAQGGLVEQLLKISDTSLQNTASTPQTPSSSTSKNFAKTPFVKRASFQPFDSNMNQGPSEENNLPRQTSSVSGSIFSNPSQPGSLTGASCRYNSTGCYTYFFQDLMLLALTMMYHSPFPSSFPSVPRSNIKYCSDIYSI